MTPAGTARCWRKGLRRTRRGIPTGRRATREVRTTYGHRQRERDRRMAWLMADARAEMAAAMAAVEAPAPALPDYRVAERMAAAILPGGPSL
jgi:hypothetical protein